MKQTIRIFMLLLAFGAIPGWGQIWDRTGNAKLSGDYFFRNVAWLVDPFGDVSGAYSLYGVLTFDGRGNYTISATYYDGRSLAVADSGTYSIGSNGYGLMDHPAANGSLLLTVANGVVLGSSVDAGFNDLMMAVPLGSANAATFNGAYTMAYMNIFNSLVENHYDSRARFTANGAGNIGNAEVQSFLAGNPTTPINQTETNVRYSFQNGIGRIDFPTSGNPAIGGQKMLAISPDGNLIFGGSATGFDFFVGVRRTANSTPEFSGLYFQTGWNLDASLVPTNNGGAVDTYLGSLVARAGILLGHQRLISPRRQTQVNYTSSADFPSNPDPEYTETASSTEWTFSADGAIRIGFGIGPFLGITVAVRAPEPASPGGPFVSSIGVINGASFAPFTAGIARGQQITIFGSELASEAVSATSTSLPSSLGGVQVLVNGRAAPLIYVSPGQVSAVVPFGVTDSIAQIQVMRGDTLSNAVTQFVYPSAPGVFAQTAAGHGYGAAQDLNYQLVTPGNPLDPGEFFAVYLTGLGEVFPTIQDGAPGGTVQLNETTIEPVVRIGGQQAVVSFAGLAPGYAGLYQVNAQVPEGVSGDVSLEVDMGYAITVQTLLPVSTDATAARQIATKRR